MQLGSLIESALSTVGITDDRVSRWLGRPCGCKERVEKVNAVSRWASMVVRGRIKDAEKYLNAMVGGNE